MENPTEVIEPKTMAMIEEPLKTEPVVGDGWEMLGLWGDSDEGSMRDRHKRQEGYKARLDFRDCIPCSHCFHCITLKKFDKHGEMVTSGYLCERGEMEVSEFTTCNEAYRTRNGRIRVFVDMTGAPRKARARMSDLERELRERQKRESMPSQVKPTRPPEGYLGGSEYYVPKIGEDGAHPTKLMN